MPTTSEITERYLENHPSIKDCLKKNIINHSKLSRIIAKELNIEKKTSLEAINIACRRYKEKIKHNSLLENKILEILKQTELEIKNKIVVIVIEKNSYSKNSNRVEKRIQKSAETFYLIEGSKVFTLITSEKYLETLKDIFEKSIIKITRNLAMITMKSPKALENTSGVNAFVYAKFAENGINIVEQMSCWTDTLCVISEDDISAVMNFLKF